MNEIPDYENLEHFQSALRAMHKLRKETKTSNKRNRPLTEEQRKHILLKTDSRCHVCGVELDINRFECDHVKSHTSGGTNIINNFLPACKTCNNYRWHYLSEEFQWILKIGVWARTEIARDTKIGNDIGLQFLKKEQARESRRKLPRKC